MIVTMADVEDFGHDFSGAHQKIAGALRKQFPGAFRTVRPLALGITQAIVARSRFTQPEIAAFMAWYTRTLAYLAAQAAPGAMRYDLDGNVVEPVNTANASFAAHCLAEVKEARRRDAQWQAFKANLLKPVDLKEQV